MIEKTRDIFDDWARTGRDAGMETGHLPRAEQALEMMPVTDGDRVIDLGCGNGWASRWLRNSVGDSGSVLGLDIAPEMVQKAKSLSAGRSGIDFQVGAFEALPLADASVDHAFSMEALYYAEDLDQALDEIHRVLVAGGTFCFCTDFFAENPYCRHWPDMMGIPMELHSISDWSERFRAKGFKVVEVMRCLDPRPVDPKLDPKEAAELRDFRENIGALALLVAKA